jgi:hypothetical protein
VTKIGALGTTQAATSNRRTLRKTATTATRRNNPEDTILHSHRRENLKSYIFWQVRCGMFQNLRSEYNQSLERNFHVIKRFIFLYIEDRLCSLVVRVPGC